MTLVNPAGCVNGSAQLKSDDQSNTKQLLRELEELYNQLPQFPVEELNQRCQPFYAWMQNLFGEQNLKSILRTSYHAVSKNNVSFSIKW